MAFDPNSNRESYLKALGEIQERRLGPEKNHLTQKLSLESFDDAKVYDSSDIYASITRDSLIRSKPESTSSDFDEFPGYNDQDVDKSYYNITDNRLMRRSLPVKVSRAFAAKTNRKKSLNTKNAFNNSSVIIEDEIKQFESLHCNNNISRIDSMHSPPAKFFKNSSHPYVSPPPPLPPPNATNDKHEKIGNSKRQRHLLFGSGSSCPDDNISSGSYLNYDENSSSVWSERTFGVPESGGKMAPLKLRYEHHINKFGEIVEYAVPEGVSYSDRDTDSPPELLQNVLQNKTDRVLDVSLPPPPPAPPGSPFQTFIVEENLNFCNQNSFQSEQPPALGQSVRITDLDESLYGDMEGTMCKGTQKTDLNKNICKEFSSLVNWSDSIKNQNSSFEIAEKVSTEFVDSNMFDILKCSSFIWQYKCSIAMCKPKDIKYGGLPKFGHRFATQLEFSSGTFRKSTVTIRKCNARMPETVRLAEEAIERDYDILKR